MCNPILSNYFVFSLSSLTPSLLKLLQVSSLFFNGICNISLLWSAVYFRSAQFLFSHLKETLKNILDLNQNNQAQIIFSCVFLQLYVCENCRRPGLPRCSGILDYFPIGVVEPVSSPVSPSYESIYVVHLRKFQRLPMYSIGSHGKNM